VFDKSSPGHRKACAGGISFPAYGLAPIPENIIERKITSSRVIAASGKSVTVGNAAEPGFTVYRKAYDAWLMEEAEKAGAKVVGGTVVESVEFGKDGVLLKTRRQENREDVQCSLVVGAFGCSSRLYKSFGITPPACLVGLSCDLSLPESAVSERIGDTIEVYFDTAYANPGYSWIFPKKSGVNAGIITLMSVKDKTRLLQDFIGQHPVVSPKLEGAVPLRTDGGGLSGSLIPVRALSRTYGNRFVLVGDAAGLADPLTYEGIGYALESGILAAETIAGAFQRNDLTEQALSSYQRNWLVKIYAAEIMYSEKLARIMYGHQLSNVLGEILVSMAQEDAEIGKALGYILNRKQSRKRVYEILMSRKMKLIDKLGLPRTAQLLPRLLS
jgi:geranylgeranyl reductase family protein